MNAFDETLKQHGLHPLKAGRVSTLQVNLGYKCNLRCTHCHVEASPDRKETMPLRTMVQVLDVLRQNSEISTVDITGGSPELHPYFRYFVKSCVYLWKDTIVRTNLAVLEEKGCKDIPEFLAQQKVKIIASLPCYTRDGVDSQRGKGTFDKAVTALRRLNDLGYGKSNTGLEIDIMFNPGGAAISPDQKELEKAYRSNLKEMHGVIFNRLIVLSNMPIGRLGKSLSEDEHRQYLQILQNTFNPKTVKHLMCRHLVSVSPEGKIHDCDFWQVMKLAVRSKSSDVKAFDYSLLQEREILTNGLCFLCTAGSGASCGGALT